MGSKTLLLDWICYRPVGHAVEAFAAAADYHRVSPDLHIHVLVNSETPIELARWCPWVTAAYGVDVDEVAAVGAKASCLSRLPGEWDTSWRRSAS